MKRPFVLFSGVFVVFAALAVPHRVALVVQNHTSDAPTLPMAAFADTLTSRLSGKTFSVVNPHNVFGVNQNRTAVGEIMPEVSAQEIGRMTGAEGVVTASIQEFTGRDIRLEGKVVGHKLRVRLALNLADAATGDTKCGVDGFEDSKNCTVEDLKANTATLYEELMHQAAAKAAEKLLAKVATIEWNPGVVKPLNIFFGCNVLGADVQIDGLSYGTCPAQIEVAPGPHNVLVSYPPYYLNFARRAMFTKDGQQYAVVLQITPEGEKVRRSGELFDKQKALFDAQLGRYKDAGMTEDYVRKTIADGVAMYWKNSYGRIVITEGVAENIDFTTAHVDAADLQEAPNTSAQVKKMQATLSQAGAAAEERAKDASETLSEMKTGIDEGATPVKMPDSK